MNRATENPVKAKRREHFQRYLAYYGVALDPFSDYQNVGLFFPGGGRRKLVDELMHFSRYGSAPILLLGGVGSGKSTVLREFAQQLPADSQVVVIEAQLLLSQEQLIAEVLSQLQVQRAASENEPPLEKLRSWLADQTLRRRLAVICFDDAHNLTKDFLDQVIVLQQQFPDTCKLVFCGEFELREYVAEACDRHSLLVNVLEVPALSDEALAGYASYRLDSVGFGGRFPFSDMQLKAAALRSQGSVARLNDQLREMLLAGVDGGKYIQRPFPVAHSIAAGALLLVLVLIWQSDVPEMSDDSVELAPIVLESMEDQDDIEAFVRLDVDSEGLPVTQSQRPVGQGDPESAILSALQENVAPDSAKANNEATPLPANIAIAANTTIAAQVATQGDSIEEDVGDQLILQNAGKLDESGDVPGATGALAGGNTGLAAETDAGLSRTDLVYRRLLSWPQGSYALQVFGTHDETRASELVKQYFGEADLLYYETRHNGRAWYAVISGPYTGREAAQKSIESLPEKLQRLRPWPRNVASIKSDVRRYATIVGE